MARRDDLFELIQTLTPNEKRYFKLQASLQSGEKEYLLVFNAMAKQKIYNDAAVQNILDEQGVKTPLFRIKHYLYGQILRSLKAMEKHEKTELKLNDLAKETWILYNKKLPNQALKKVDKAIALARKEEMRLLEAYFIDFKIEILSRRETGSPEHEEVRELYNQVQEALRKATIDFKYVELKKRMFILMRKEGNRSSPDSRRWIEELHNDAYMQDEELAEDFMARYNFYQAHFFYHITHDNVKEAYYYCQKQIEWFRQSPEWQKTLSTNYIIALNNNVSAAMTLGQIDVAEDILKELESMPYGPYVEQVSQFTFIYHTRAEILWVKKDYAEMLKFFTETRAELGKFLPYINHFRLAGIHLLHSQAHLLCGQPDEALDYMLEACKLLDQQKYPRMVTILKIQEVLAHYSLGNFKIIDHLIRSITRQKLLANCLHPYEKEMLSSLKKASNVQDINTRLTMLVGLAERLKQLQDQDPHPGEPGYNFQFIEWIEMTTGKTTN